MNFRAFGVVLWVLLPFGESKGIFSKFTNQGRNENDQGSEYADGGKIAAVVSPITSPVLLILTSHAEQVLELKITASLQAFYLDVCETIRVMPRIAMAVVGGAPLKLENSAPYIAAVGERISNGSVSWFCGGSLVSSSHVLTAAHCLVSRNVSTIRVGSFSAKKRPTENDYEIVETIIHPGYKITQSYNDIGILRVNTKIKFDRNIKPVCLPETNSETHERERAKVIGWGAEEFGGEGTQKLQHVEVEVFSNADCEKAYRNSTIAPKTFPKGIKSEQLCAGSKKGGKDACQGDSGGPLVLTDQQGIVRQIGIVSTGAGCGFKMYPGVYTRVSSYVSWIQEQIQKSDSVKSPLRNDHTSKENSNRTNPQPLKPKGTSTNSPTQGTLLNAQLSPDTKNTRNNTASQNNSRRTQNSRETYSGREFSGDENFQKSGNKTSGTTAPANSLSDHRKSESDLPTRETRNRENPQQGQNSGPNQLPGEDRRNHTVNERKGSK